MGFIRGAKVLVAASLLAMGLTACSKQEQSTDANLSSIDRIKKNDVVRIGVFTDKPPFGYLDEKGNNQGFDVEIAKHVAKDLLGDEKKVQFVPTEAANRVEYLKSNKVDIIFANFTITPERKEVVDYAKPYLKVALGIVSPKDHQITDLTQLKDKILLVNKGTTADNFFTKNHPEIKLQKYEQNTETFDALKDGRGAALAHDNLLVLAWAKENPNFKVGIPTLGQHDFIAPAVKKGDTALLNWLDQEMDKLTKEGVMQQAYEKTLKPVYGTDISEKELLIE
ncbi:MULTISPECIES: cysteine ABC transporter substrate-binding protein [Acinetobacter]|jgi:polar amino acid transport system substrate-binding protein|uniref:Cysteine ABC transporter substrate-binding protein n=1 Tax=Acinetobacter pollinis TaxID=2605270 RepID=A0ABU6DR15_9GAMM|nr:MULTISPECIES: cysteine ABC transporter substrate-binding protein [Acinetobacter]MBF7690529.1 cysteine ABC transporter substrate-binding protein [Acinetobacter pollinis]MBF7693388.1 cysteine ABC transporter substrate-binding protein [Acinetobacter pollinis]MBF7698013.1 cysteine ABC transporter substrate-binding protein [Acinetobacter pollinis]MBF7700900.1 cysteine ABC transporter substrate-binding protein [Acinetobacter pollinis]MEB5476310.1 cysteine ABC transporter substrate-binding protein